MDAFASFRFLTLNDKQAKELAEHIPSTEFGIHEDTGKNVGCIKLEDSSHVVAIDQFRKENELTAVECDVFISIASENTSEAWRAPKAVNYIINIVNCPIVFSYS